MPKIDIGKSIAHIPRATELKLARDSVKYLLDLGGDCQFEKLLSALQRHWYFNRESYAGKSSRKTIGYYIKTALYLGLIQMFDEDGKVIPAEEIPLMDFRVTNTTRVQITTIGKQLLQLPTNSSHSNYFEVTDDERNFLLERVFISPGYLPAIYLSKIISDKPGLDHNAITRESMINWDSVKIFISGWSRENELDVTERGKEGGVYVYKINPIREAMLKKSFKKFDREIEQMIKEAKSLKGEVTSNNEIRKEIIGEVPCDTIIIPDELLIDDHDICAEYSALIFKRFGMNPQTRIKLSRGVKTDIFNEGFNIIFDVKIGKETRSRGSSSGKIVDKDVNDFLRYRDQIATNKPHLKNFAFIIIGYGANREQPFDADAIRQAYQRDVGLIDINALLKLDKARQEYLALTEDMLTLLNELRNIKKYIKMSWEFDSFDHRKAFKFEREFKDAHDSLVEATIIKMKKRSEEMEKTLGRKLTKDKRIKLQTALKHRDKLSKVVDEIIKAKSKTQEI